MEKKVWNKIFGTPTAEEITRIIEEVNLEGKLPKTKTLSQRGKEIIESALDRFELIYQIYRYKVDKLGEELPPLIRYTKGIAKEMGKLILEEDLEKWKKDTKKRFREFKRYKKKMEKI